MLGGESYTLMNNVTCDSLSSERKLSLDEACLTVTNFDALNILDLWAQVEECYNCSSWKFLSLKPRTSSFLKVNSTYVTNIFIETPLSVCLHKYRFHFDQHGIYSVKFNSSHFYPIATEQQGNNEYAAILAAALFFFFLYVFVLAAKFLHFKMEEGRFSRYTSRRENVTNLSEESLSIYNEASETEPLNQIEATSHSVSKRLNSLDTFRGYLIAIIMMIFVNYKGGKYYFFNHSPWNGLTVADLVFPWFMWIMGVSLILSIHSQLRRQVTRSSMVFKIFKRSFILFGLGIINNSLKSNNLPNFRIFGVLQRFSLCYFINAIPEVFFMKGELVEYDSSLFRIQDLFHSWAQWLIIDFLVIVHTVLTFALKVPGCPTGYLGPGGIQADGAYVNCTGGSAGFIDRVFLGENHMYGHPSCKQIYDSSMHFDPEGPFGTLTSCLTVQLGLCAGRIIHYYETNAERLWRWLMWGIILGIIAGFLCSWSKETGIIPVNKNLWSLSFVFVTASFAMFLFAILYYFIDAKEKWNGGIFRAMGMNSILLYIGHEATKGVFPWSWTPSPKTHSGILFMSIWGTSLWVLIGLLCHKKKLYLSI
ncbi:Heparan-alpha-glucosaminide N-acetyltransferase [Armadillidium nasatum]|uniref:Heparan-alpha-glucosaminide N-acetyltransferase n=1 Tax=Armadillidium nasatum TaxID=96803 RepID=A0A5N5SXF4_9CRUS|nr:Heparan-alpha-glucosaminide N-acetyltransferase [Armadillidium nasatum]